MGKRIIGLIMALLVLNLVFVSRAQNVPVLYQTPLLRSLQATGAEVSSAYMQSSGTLEMIWQSPAVWPGLAQQLAASLGFTEAAAKVQNESWQAGGYRCQFAADGQTLTIYFLTVPDSEPVIRVDYRLPIAEESDLQHADNELREIMKNLSPEPVVYTCLNGYIDGKLKGDGLKRSLEDGFASIGAEITNRYETPVGFYYSGSAPFLVGDAAEPLPMGIEAHFEAASGRMVYQIGSADLFRLAGL